MPEGIRATGHHTHARSSFSSRRRGESVVITKTLLPCPIHLPSAYLRLAESIVVSFARLPALHSFSRDRKPTIEAAVDDAPGEASAHVIRC